ncbi:hypothetical protein [Rouxiella sp. WC2420]|uniref:Uncharacterized protein n=1 Tax=Rouxiella sp. WC2420 TaxID=3234145 RepID=A0AB39VJZ7_9GAMM
MQRNDEEKLNDSLLGEAVLAVLKSGGDVTIAGVVIQLKSMAASAKNDVIKRACERTLGEVNQTVTSTQATRSYNVRDTNNVLHHFTAEGQQDGKKNH